MRLASKSPPQRADYLRRKFAWVLLIFSLLLVSLATVLLVRHYRLQSRLTPRDGEWQALEEDSEPPPDDCRTPATDALGLGLTRFASESEAVAALGNQLLLPDPVTLPEAATFASGYYNASMQGSYRQSTIGLRFETPVAAVEMAIFSIKRYEGPIEEHSPVTVRGRSGYLFQPPFQEGLHAVMWREDCRWVSVAADLPAAQVLAIAEGLRRPS